MNIFCVFSFFEPYRPVHLQLFCLAAAFFFQDCSDQFLPNLRPFCPHKFSRDHLFCLYEQSCHTEGLSYLLQEYCEACRRLDLLLLQKIHQNFLYVNFNHQLICEVKSLGRRSSFHCFCNRCLLKILDLATYFDSYHLILGFQYCFGCSQ